MEKLAAVAAAVLLASCLSAVPMPDTTVHPGPAIVQRSQTDGGTSEMPTFHSGARQVLVTVAVWKHAAKDAAWVPKEILKRYPILASASAMAPIARGLSAKDFHIFDDGAERQINYLEESDFSWRDIDDQRFFYPHLRGIWGRFGSEGVWLAAPTATYTIGYIPPPSQSGDCHTIRVTAGDNDVVLNRSRYCDSNKGDMATVEGSKLAAQMEAFAQSSKRGSISVSIQASVFWSARVLSLLRDNNPAGTGISAASAAPDYTYTVVVHDSKAPAMVQIATEYELETNQWGYPCPSSNAAIHVFGVVYNGKGEIVQRFGDSFPCRREKSSALIYFGWETVGIDPTTWFAIPSRFNTQVELRPGDYDVHVVVSDGHRFGQARMPLRVEAIDGQALTISDIALNGILRDASWILRDAATVSPAPLVPSPLVSKHAQFIPVPDAHIPKRSRLPLYFEVYEPLLAEHSAEVFFRVKITDLKDGTVVMNAGPTSAAECVTPGNLVVPIALNVDTDRLPSGQYKIEVQASDSAGHSSEWRTAKFEIQ